MSQTKPSERQRPARISQQNHSIMSSSVLLSLCFLLISIGQLQQPHSVVVVGFTPISTAVYQRHPQHQFVGSRYFMTDYVEESNNNSNENDDSADFGDAGVLIEDLSWRVEKMRLEEQNKQRFLKAKPRFLPYADAAKWVQAWGQRWKTQQDWYDRYIHCTVFADRTCCIDFWLANLPAMYYCYD